MVQPPVVIDASIALSIVRNEPDGLPAAAAISGWTRSGARIVVPSNFWLEVTNSLLVRRGLPGSEVLQAVHDLDLLRLDTIELDRAGLLLTIDLSERHGLTSYEATYLALAISLDGSLATFDARLRTAAGARALHVGSGSLAEVPTAYEHTVTWPDYKGASAYLSKLRSEALRPS